VAAPSDRELLAYLGGDADVAITTHLAGCRDCQQRAANLAAVEQRLTTSLFRFDCPPSLVLGEYQLGLLSAADTRALDAHVKLCPHCAGELADLHTYLCAVAPTLELEPTSTIFDRARLVVARLAQDLSSFGAPSGVMPAAAGMRGEVGDQLVYTVDALGDAVQVVIDVQADAQNPTQRMILGLILGLSTPQQLTAHLWHTDQAATTTLVDQLGNFVLTGLMPGAYDLILRGDQTEIYLQNLSI